MDLFSLTVPNGLKPNLAGKFDADKAKFPCLASAKIDGIRALGLWGGLISRSLKEIPNRFVQSRFADVNGYDGELVMGEPFAKDCMQRTSSAVMSIKGEPDVKFYVFDNWSHKGKFTERYASLRDADHPHVVVVPQVVINNQGELDVFEQDMVGIGYEGVMLRQPDARYKFGRSTTNEGGLLKLKRFEQDEAIIVGVEELVRVDGSLGGMLGALVCQRLSDGTAFSIGSGFTQQQRQDLWIDRPINKIVRYNHFAVSGVKTAPRFPTFAGFRHPHDMSD